MGAGRTLSFDGGRPRTSGRNGAMETMPLMVSAGGPYAVQRGKRLWLKGAVISGALQPDDEIVWTFETHPRAARPRMPYETASVDAKRYGGVATLAVLPNLLGLDDAARPREQARRSGLRTEIVILDSLTVRLTVFRNRAALTSAETEVLVTPRPWRTTFTADKTAGGWQVDRYSELTQNNGTTRCKHEENSPSAQIGHFFHPGGGDFETSQYALATVDDPDGPFHGYAYVGENRCAVTLKVLVNADLLRGVTYKRNQEKGGTYADGLKALVAKITDHEAVHCDLIAAALKSAQIDPAVRIETLYGPKRETVKFVANQIVDDADTILKLETSHRRFPENALAKYRNKSATIQVGDGSGGWKDLTIKDLSYVDRSADH